MAKCALVTALSRAVKFAKNSGHKQPYIYKVRIMDLIIGEQWTDSSESVPFRCKAAQFPNQPLTSWTGG